MKNKFKYYSPYFPIIGMILVVILRKKNLCLFDFDNKNHTFHFLFSAITQGILTAILIAYLFI